jgi:hypothetical protein
MGNGPAGFGEIGQFWEKPEVQAAFHVVGNPEPDNATANAIKPSAMQPMSAATAAMTVS